MRIDAGHRPAPDPLKRRTDIMHRAQVRRADPEGIRDVVRQLLEFLIARAQCLLGLFALRDVELDALRADQFPVGVVNRPFQSLEILGRAVGVGIKLLPAQGFPRAHDPFMVVRALHRQRALPFHRCRRTAGGQGGFFVKGNFHGGLADDFLRLQAFEPAKHGIDEGITAGGVFAENPGGQVLHQRMVKRLRIQQQLLGPFAVADVFMRHHHPQPALADEPGHPDNEPALLMRAVARIFQAKLAGLSGQDSANAARHGGGGGTPVGHGVADFEVVLAHAVVVALKFVLASKPVPGGVDFQDRPLLIQNRDMRGKRIERGFQEKF